MLEGGNVICLFLPLMKLLPQTLCPGIVHSEAPLKSVDLSPEA